MVWKLLWFLALFDNLTCLIVDNLLIQRYFISLSHFFCCIFYTLSKIWFTRGRKWWWLWKIIFLFALIMITTFIATITPTFAVMMNCSKRLQYFRRLPIASSKILSAWIFIAVEITITNIISLLSLLFVWIILIIQMKFWLFLNLRLSIQLHRFYILRWYWWWWR